MLAPIAVVSSRSPPPVPTAPHFPDTPAAHRRQGVWRPSSGIPSPPKPAIIDTPERCRVLPPAAAAPPDGPLPNPPTTRRAHRIHTVYRDFRDRAARPWLGETRSEERRVGKESRHC